MSTETAAQPGTVPNPADFELVTFPNSYEAEISVTLTLRVTLKADSKEAAFTAADALADKIEEEGLDGMDEVALDSVDDAQVGRVYETPSLYRVIRDGKVMRVSRLQAGDLPRPADAHGF